MSTTTNASGGKQGGRFSQAALWASACVIAALIIVQAGRMGPEPARADVVSSVGGMTALTFESQSEDLLAVIDGRSENLFVYRVENKNSLDLLRSYSLPTVFAEARSRAGGGGRQR